MILTCGGIGPVQEGDQDVFDVNHDKGVKVIMEDLIHKVFRGNKVSNKG